MLLVIDVGNTETVFGIYKGDTLCTHWRLSSPMYRTMDETWILLNGWCQLQQVALGEVQGVAISSVVPNLTSMLVEMTRKYFQLEPLVISAEIDTGVVIRYESPKTVGADRICNAVGGIVRFGAPLVIVDFGTAITLDVVSEKKEYLGGVICLGLKSASQQLHTVAAKLPRVELIFPQFVIGRDTETSIQSGLLWGTVVMVDGLIERIEKELGVPSLRAIATGGQAGFVAPHCHRIEAVEPFLTLEGMKYIYNRIKSQKQGG